MSAERVAIEYDGLIVTTIITKSEAGSSNVVTFNEYDGNGVEAVFLHKIREISDPQQVERGKREFSATKLSIDEAKKIIDASSTTSSPLFLVHGFDVEPSNSLEYNYSNFQKDIYYHVPVIWASEGNTLAYYGDQDKNSINAGDAMKAFVDFIPNDTFSRKSLVMHSMGNHAVFNGACASATPDVTFDNIFMVAADVPYDIFHKEPYEGYWFSSQRKVSGNKFEKATNFFGMLTKKSDGTPNGKIYILWNKDDVALNGSFLANSEKRIGVKGKGWIDGWFTNSRDDKVIRDDLVNYIDEFDVTGKPMKKENQLLKHSYFLEPFAVEFYEEKELKSRQNFP